VVQVLGEVLGGVVRARNVFSNLGASLRTIFGGEVTQYTQLLVDSRNQGRWCGCVGPPGNVAATPCWQCASAAMKSPI